MPAAAENGSHNDLSIDEDELRERLRSHGQEHLVAYWDKLTAKQRSDLAREISDIDVAAVCRYHKRCIAQADNVAKLDHKIEPLPAELVGSVTRSDSAKLSHYEHVGTYFDMTCIVLKVSVIGVLFC